MPARISNCGLQPYHLIDPNYSPLDVPSQIQTIKNIKKVASVQIVSGFLFWEIARSNYFASSWRNFGDFYLTCMLKCLTEFEFTSVVSALLRSTGSYITIDWIMRENVISRCFLWKYWQNVFIVKTTVQTLLSIFRNLESRVSIQSQAVFNVVGSASFVRSATS